MSKSAVIVLALLFVLLGASTISAPSPPQPLHESELLALVAGNALPENIAAEIRSRGLAFSSDKSYRDLLKAAGADASVLSALESTKRNPSSPVEKPNAQLLQHLSAAGKLIREKKFDDAANELTPALAGNFERYEVGFVMGELLRHQERWRQAAAVYAEVLEEAPDFPEAHTKLSYIMYNLDDGEEALRQAKAALARTPENAEAHKNAGLALHVLGKLDAAIAEDKEALRIKPDYAVVHYNLALIFQQKQDLDSAVAESQKAIRLAPDFEPAHNNLGNYYRDKGDFPSALREYREAKRLDPHDLLVRQNLALLLQNKELYAEAIREYREMEALFPASELCHLCLGNALHATWDLKGAKNELLQAARLDPSDPRPLTSLGLVFETENNLDAALEIYRKAGQLDPNSPDAHRAIGRVMLANKNASEAAKELKIASNLEPSNAHTHDLYAQALALSGDSAGAADEFRTSIALDPEQADVMLELAKLLEKQGDWPRALAQYQRAAKADRLPEKLSPGVPYRTYSAQKQYDDAQKRLAQYILALRRVGKATEAANLEKAITDAQSGSSDSDTLDSLMQSASQARQERRFDDAERDYKKALSIAEKIQPLDIRVATCLDHLGELAAARKDFTSSDALFERALQVTERLYGPQNAALAEPMKWLAVNAVAKSDIPAAEMFLNRALDVNRRAFGETSESHAEILRFFAGIYLYKQQFDKAEPYFIQAAGIEEKLYQYDPRYAPMSTLNLWQLCSLYEKWNKPEKLDSCDRRLITAFEKDRSPTGEQSLAMTLTREAKTLRTLGRTDEAAEIERRLKALGPAAANNP